MTARIPKYRMLLSMLFAMTLAGCSPLLAQQMNIAAVSARDIWLVQLFGGGSPLTASERVELDGAVRQSFTLNPSGAQAAAAESAKILALIQNKQGVELVTAVQFGRKAIAFSFLQALSPQPVTATAARIVAAHDPVVAADPAKQFLVTMQTVKALAESDRKGAALFSVPDPGPSGAQTLATAIQRVWPATDDGMREALTNAQRDLPFTEPYLAHSPPAARSKFVEQYHRTILEGSDPSTQQLRLAEVMAFVGQTGFKNRGSLGGAGNAINNATEMQSARDRAGRALMPGCGVAAGSVMSPEKSQFCNPSPLP